MSCFVHSQIQGFMLHSGLSVFYFCFYLCLFNEFEKSAFSARGLGLVGIQFLFFTPLQPYCMSPLNNLPYHFTPLLKPTSLPTTSPIPLPRLSHLPYLDSLLLYAYLFTLQAYRYPLPPPLYPTPLPHYLHIIFYLFTPAPLFYL